MKLFTKKIYTIFILMLLFFLIILNVNAVNNAGTWENSGSSKKNSYSSDIDLMYRLVENINKDVNQYNQVDTKNNREKVRRLNEIKTKIKNYKNEKNEFYLQLQKKGYIFSTRLKKGKLLEIPKLKIIDNGSELLRNMSDEETISYVQEKMKGNLYLINKVLGTKYGSNDITGGISRTTIIGTSSHTPAEIEMNQKIKNLTIDQANLYFDYKPPEVAYTVQKDGRLSIKESSYQRISEEYGFKVYEADVTATDGDIILEKIDLVQFGSGEGINIGELYKRDYGGNMLKLSTSRDERVYKFYKRDGNPGISFDLFTGLEPGMKIRNGETVKFTITIDSMSFSEYGKDFQRTNIFYVKYKLKSQEALVSGDKPQIIVYRACDEGVTITTDSTPIVFDENFNMDLFSTGKVSDRSLDGLAMPVQYYYTKNLGSDLSAYQNDIREKFIDSGTTYSTWLNKKYISGLVEAYQDKQKPWLFMGYKSKVNTQFRPTNGMQCKDIVEVAKAERIAFKTTYDDIVSSFNQDRINQLTERVSELEAINAGCAIKGNVNFVTGEKIYHLPGATFYDQTDIDTIFGERWFCSESDAINAGWRKERGY